MLIDKILRNLKNNSFLFSIVQRLYYSSNKLEITRDIPNEVRAIADFISLYTMTSLERIYSLFQAVEYITRKGIKGDIVECGVWRGGSMMLVTKMLH